MSASAARPSAKTHDAATTAGRVAAEARGEEGSRGEEESTGRRRRRASDRIAHPSSPSALRATHAPVSTRHAHATPSSPALITTPGEAGEAGFESSPALGTCASALTRRVCPLRKAVAEGWRNARRSSSRRATQRTTPPSSAPVHSVVASAPRGAATDATTTCRGGAEGHAPAATTSGAIPPAPPGSARARPGERTKQKVVARQSRAPARARGFVARRSRHTTSI